MIRTRAWAVALLVAASCAGPVQAQQSQPRAWCGAGEAEGVSIDQQISVCTDVILGGKATSSTRAIAYSNRAGAWFAKGRHEQAIQDFNSAIRIEPKDADIYSNRGFVYRAIGKLDRALEDFDQAIRLAPNHVTAWRNRGITYREQGRHQRAIKDFDHALRLKPDDPVTLYERNLAKGKTGDTEGAAADLAAARRINPGIGR